MSTTVALPQHNIGPSINAALWVLFGLATASVGLRIGARLKRNLKFGPDDFFMFLSLIFNLGACICASVAIHWGLGAHTVDIDPTNLSNTILWGLVAVDIGLLCDVFPKMAIALLINRLLMQPTWVTVATTTWAASLVVVGITLIIISFVQCSPIQHQWSPHTVAGSCWSPSIFGNYAIFAGTWSAAIDLFFSVYPCYMISKLHMPLRKKVAVISTLALGLLSFAVTTYKTAVQLPRLKDPRTDFSVTGAQIMLWTIVEGSVVIIAGSIPTWGWLLRTEGFKQMIGWLHVKEFVSSHVSNAKQSLGSSGDTQPTEDKEKAMEDLAQLHSQPRMNYYEHRSHSTDSQNHPTHPNSPEHTEHWSYSTNSTV